MCGKQTASETKSLTQKGPNAKILFFWTDSSNKKKTHVSIIAGSCLFSWIDAVCMILILLILQKNINTMFQHSVFVFVCTDIEQQEDVV